MSYSHKVIEANNLAVAMIKNRHYHKAISSLKTALKAHQQESNSSTNNYIDHSSIDKCVMQSSHLAKNMLLGDNNEYMHSQGIFIPFKNKLLPQYIPSVLIFNLALAHHLSSKIKSKSHRVSDLKKAAKLYQLAYNANEEFCESNILFTLATVNNLGLIQKELNDKEASQQCFDHLLSVVMFLVDSKRSLDMESDHIDGFLRNVAFANGDICPAAAA